MDCRPHSPCSRLFCLFAVVALLASTGGCHTALATAIYIIKGTDVDPEFDGLREKRVAVVCRPLAGLTYRDSSAARDLARQMSQLLRQKVRKIEMVDQRQVDEWVDENTYDEFVEIGQALEADLIVGVDLEHFGIFQGQTVYQGKANVTVMVQDCKTSEILFEKSLPQVRYPPNSPRSTGDQQEADFRREFIGVLADQVARHFYPHDPHADFALDAAYIP